MKKFLALMMAAIILFALASCSAAPNKTEEGEEQKPTAIIGYTIYEPMNYQDENGELVGFDTELAKAVFNKLGYDVVFKLIEWDQKYTELDSSTITCIWNGFTANTSDKDGIARSEKVDFSYNYMRNKQVIVTSKDLAPSVTDNDSLSGKTGAVEAGSAGESFLEELNGSIKAPVTSQLDAIKNLTLNTADFAVVDDQLAKAYVGEGAYADLTIVETVSGVEEFYAIGFKKGSDLTARVNAALEELAADGTITALAKKYGVENTAIIDFADQKK